MQEAIVALATELRNAQNQIQDLQSEIESKNQYINQIEEYAQEIQQRLLEEQEKHKETHEELRGLSIDYDLQSRELADVQDNYDCLETQYNLLLQKVKVYHPNK